MKIKVGSSIIGLLIVVVSLSLVAGISEVSSAMPYPPPGNFTAIPSGLPTPFETPIMNPPPIENAQAWLPMALYEYPWAYGGVDGTLVNKYTREPVDGVCLKLAKVWCDDDDGMPEGCYFVYADEWSPAAFTEPYTGDFLVDTHVAYATRENGVRPHDGGTGWFVPIAFEYCTIWYGAYDIIEEGAPNGYTARVIRVFPDQTTYVGELGTWFEEPIGRNYSDDIVTLGDGCTFNYAERSLTCPLLESMIK